MSVQETNLKAIADAIREKDGTTEPIPASAFPDRILAIPAGGLPEDVYTITVEADPPEGGSVSGGGMASAGMVVTVNAGAVEGYSFSRWLEGENLISNEAEYSFQVGTNRALNAIFEVQKVSRLPDGYTELEYIETVDGKQGITPGIYPSTDLKTVVDFQLTKSSKEISGYTQRIVFSYLSAKIGTIQGTYNYTVQDFNGNLLGNLFGITAGSTSSSGAGIIGDIGLERTQITLDASSNSITANNKKVSVPYKSRSFPANMPEISLFYSIGYNSGIFGKVFSCQIYKGGNIVRDFVPCTNPESQVGMYDLVEQRFYGNSGTGSFIAGPAI